MKILADSAAVLAVVLALLPFGMSAGGEGPDGFADGYAIGLVDEGADGSGDEGRHSPRAHHVTIQAMRFEPARLTVAPGDTVIWVNHDFVPHTATAADGEWNSGTLGQGDRWSLVVQEGDSIDYTCLFHPTMSGRLVQDGRPLTDGDDT